MQRQNQFSNTGSAQGYGSYGNATVSHLPPGYNQPLGAGRHAPQHSLSSSQQPQTMPMGASYNSQYSRSPSPAPTGHSGQMSMGMQPTMQQYATVPQASYTHQMQPSMNSQRQPAMPSSGMPHSFGQNQVQDRSHQQMSSNMHMASDYSQQFQQNQYEQSRGVASGITASGLTNSATINNGMTTSGLTNSASITSSGLTNSAMSSRYETQGSQNALGMSQGNAPHTLGASSRMASMAAQNGYDLSQMYDPRPMAGMTTSQVNQERGERRQEQLQTLALNSQGMADRAEGQHRRDQISEQMRQVEQMRQMEHESHQRQLQQQQQLAQQSTATQVSNSMSIRELAALVGHLPPHADPFPLIHDTLRSPSDEPTAHTTLMIRNIPTKYTQRLFLREIKAQGFDKCIDFLYLPSDSRGKGNVGYGFVNFVTTGFLSEFKKEFSELKFRQYTSQQPLTIIMSTTQGWKENLVKVIRNCVLKRQIAPEFLPLLFCRSTGQEYPFPIPSHATPNNSMPGSPAPSDGIPSKNPSVNLTGEFDYEIGAEFRRGLAGMDVSRGRTPTRSVEGSDNLSVRDASANTADSWESQRAAVEADPLAAFAGNAHGSDALGLSELRKKHAADLSAQANGFSYAGNTLGVNPAPATSSTSGFKLGSADAAAFVPSSAIGRFKTQSTEHSYEASIGNSENSWNDSSLMEGPPTRVGIQKVKAKDFFEHHGLTVDFETDHMKQVNLRKLDVRCTAEERAGTIKMPKFPITNPNGKGKGKGKGGCVYYDMAQNAKGKGKGKSLGPNATPCRATSAITSRMAPEPTSPVRSQSAKDFIELDVVDFHMNKLQTTLAAAQSESETDNAFNAAVFSGFLPQGESEISVKSTPVLNRMWSDASVSMAQMVKGIRAGHGDANGDVPSESYSDSESGRVPLFARTPELLSLASTPIRATTPIAESDAENATEIEF